MEFSQTCNNSNYGFQILQFNCNGLLSVNRIVELKLYMYAEKPDIVCLCETFVKSKNRESKFLGYHEPYSLYRLHAGRGGLSLIVKESINFKKLTLLPYVDGNLECQAISVDTEMGKIDILNVYNPHKVIKKEEYLHYISQLHTSYIMLGDFNSHSTLWELGGSTNAAGREIEKLLSEDSINLGIMNDEFSKTYFDARAGRSSCLDLCFVSSNLLINSRQTIEKDLGSDHLPVRNSFGIKLTHQPIMVKKRWKVEEASWEHFSSRLVK